MSVASGVLSISKPYPRYRGKRKICSSVSATFSDGFRRILDRCSISKIDSEHSFASGVPGRVPDAKAVPVPPIDGKTKRSLT
jgi:hypothetical protein